MTRMTRPDRLAVYLGDERIGTLFDTSPLAFEYSQSWLERGESTPIGGIGLAPGRSDSPDVEACFENLLPEGEVRRLIEKQKKASTPFSLLLEIGGDTAGGLVLLP